MQEIEIQGKQDMQKLIELQLKKAEIERQIKEITDRYKE